MRHAIAALMILGPILSSPAVAQAPGPNSPSGVLRDPLEAPDQATRPSYVPSDDALRVMTWIAATGDNNGVPYMVIDKVAAEVFIFNSSSQLIAAAPALVGMTPGDDSKPEAGDRELSDIPVADRTTPAGRFIAKFGHAAGGRDVLWVDYSTAISLHAVITTNKKQHRLERLKSPTPEDNHITFGCINVPTDFYAKVVNTMFRGTRGVVYILPETKSLNAVFLAIPPQMQLKPAVQASQ